MPRKPRRKRSSQVLQAYTELLSGIVRVGPNCHKWTDPFEYAIAWSSVDGKTAVIKALVRAEGSKIPFTMHHARAIIRALRVQGLKSDWGRFKLKELLTK